MQQINPVFKALFPIPVFAIALGASGCSSRALGGAVVGGAAVGGTYEYQNRQAIQRLEENYREGRINRNEYQRRRQEIEDRSIIY